MKNGNLRTMELCLATSTTTSLRGRTTIMGIIPTLCGLPEWCVAIVSLKTW